MTSERLVRRNEYVVQVVKRKKYGNPNDSSRGIVTAPAYEILGDYTGTILRDGYAAYNDLPAEAAGCWAHCRRKFFEAQDNSPEYARRALELIRQLYTLERQAKLAAEQKDGETALFKMRKRVRVASVGIVDSYFALW